MPLREAPRPPSPRRRRRPNGAVARVAPAELEGDAAEHQPQQHRDHQRIGRGQDDRIGEREGGEQAAAAHHQPGLVAVPDRRDGVHRLVALLAHREAGEQDADAEVEAVHHHIGEHGEGDDRRPRRRSRSNAMRSLRCTPRVDRRRGRDAGRALRHARRARVSPGSGGLRHQPQQVVDAGAEGEEVDERRRRAAKPPPPARRAASATARCAAGRRP